jgi:hypothetical protein
MEGLFAREQDFELPDLARFRVNGAGVKTKKCEEG